MDGQLYALFSCQKGLLLHNIVSAGLDIQRQDTAGKAGAEGNHPRAPGRIDILEHTLAGKRLGKHFSQSAAGCAHFHIGAHPYHGAFLRDHFFSVGQLAHHNGKTAALQFILHSICLLHTNYIFPACCGRSFSF